MNPRFALSLVAAVVAVFLAAAVPVLDEESYLDIALQLDPWRPYDWWRPWPPWGLDREADAFVYAHPPGFLLWVRSWVSMAGGVGHVAPLKIAGGLPWAMLLGWSMGRLAERTSRRPWLAGAVWVALPIVLLGLQRGLMPDLVLTALMTTSVVSWLEGHSADKPAEQTRWWVGGGLALALAVSVKYSALVLVPALVLHQLAVRPRPKALAFWVSLAAAFIVMEAILAIQYGRVHLLYVLSRAGEIGRSPLPSRALGVAVRLGFGVVLLPLLAHHWRRAVPFLLAGGVLLSMWGAPEGTPFSEHAQVAVWAGLGLGWVALAARELFSPGAPSSDRTAADGILLGAWALCGIAGVVFGHNFGAPRYLLPAMAPLTLLLVRAVALRANLRTYMWMATSVSAVGALTMVWSEHRFFDAADAAARAVVLEAPTGGCFTGEWSFRHHLQHAGWTFCGTLDDMAALPSGSFIAAPGHSSPGEVPEGLRQIHTASFGWAPVRLLDAASGVGWYGDTLGVRPVTWRPGPLEEVVLWQVP